MQPKQFCHFCGNPLERKYFEGKNRLYCAPCRRAIYENPIPATCVVVTPPAASQILLVKRNVAPKTGWWCLPGGFMELGETPEKAALRELQEETGIRGRIDRLLGVCADQSPQYDTVLMVGYHANPATGSLSPGDDAEQVRWFGFSDIPPIAFSSHTYFIEKALKPMNMEYRISTSE
jgi:ADP-ribose pyrophosphatase YjhB (NUDIX family)